MKLLAKNAEDRYQSAYGAAWDLKQCLRQLEYPTLPSQRESLIITPFELAQKDGSEKFQLPQKLYGRTDQVNVLLEAFDRVCQGATELMLVAGYSGVGKSSLVHEMYKPITAKRGYFVVGQYDQFQRDIPYSALIQAFTELVNYLLTEDAEQLAAWKAKILEAVGNNGQVLMDVIPELHHIIGDQPAVPDVLPQEARNRFNYVFQSFIRAI